MSERNLMVRSLEMKSGELQTNSIALNEELQFKMTRHDNTLGKLENDVGALGSMVRDVQARQNESNTRASLRLNDMEGRVNILNELF